MSRFFNPYNPVMEFIAKIFDLVILNLIFIFRAWHDPAGLAAYPDLAFDVYYFAYLCSAPFLTVARYVIM